MIVRLSSFRRCAVLTIAGCLFAFVFAAPAFSQFINCPITSNTTVSGPSLSFLSSSGTCVVNSGVTLTVADNGLLDYVNNNILNDGTIMNGGTMGSTDFSGALTNFGTFFNNNNLATGGTVTNAATFNNFGTLSAGTLNNTTALANAGGTINVGTGGNNTIGANLDNAGTLNLGLNSGVPIFNAEVFYAKGTFTNNGTLTNFVGAQLNNLQGFVNNGTLVNNGALANNDNFDFSLGQEFAIMTNNGTLTNNATLTTSSELDNNATFSNLGALTITGNNGFLNNNAGAMFTNGGTMTIALGSELLNRFGATLVNNGDITNAGFLDNGGTLTNAGAITNGFFFFTGTLTNAAAITNTNGGLLFVDGVLTNQAGSTFVQTGGVTSVDGTMNTVPAVQIQGGTLTGTGTINGNVVMTGGTMQPGEATTFPATPGKLTINGDLRDSNALFDEVIAASGNGLLVVNGAATLGPGALLNIDLVGGFTPFNGEMFTLMDFTSVSGVFDNAPSTGFVFAMDGFNWTIAYQTNDIILEAGSPTPEPSSLLLIASGLAGLGFLRRRLIHR